MSVREFEDAITKVRETHLQEFLDGVTLLTPMETRAVVRASIFARDQKIAAFMALLHWVTDPKYVIRYAHSEPMVRFIYENFDAWMREFFESNSIFAAAKAVHGRLVSVATVAEKDEG
jgi:hypothetical protein